MLTLLASSFVLSGPPLVVSKATIVTQPGATLAELHAAQELSDHLSEITGKKIAIQANAKSAKPNGIVIGQGPLAKSLFRDIDWSRVGGEQTLIRSKGNVLLVAGGRPRGTLYAAYRLLSQKCGVRWWTPWAVTIPHNPKLTFDNLNSSETPAFEYRDPYWFHAFDADWAARNYNNGFNARLDEAHGGKTIYEGFVHTYYGLVPPDPYFKTHPEWFSLIDGKRNFQDAQLCTTNPQLRDFLVEQVKDRLRKNPKATIISVSQNDCFRPCQCSNCRALAEREGSDGALVLDLANYVGEKIEKEFPNVAVDTLAYQWSRHPVKAMKPRKNAIVRLCSIECNFAYSLDDPKNAAFGDDIRGWSKLTSRLYVWDYCTNFAHYMAPQPDYLTLGPTLQFFAKNGVKGVFEEGAYQSNGADMAELKAWVIAQMLWDPKQNPNKLVNEFLAGYYGSAARFVREYIEFMATAGKSWNCTFASPVTATFLGYDTMDRAKGIIGTAILMTRDEPKIAWRLQQIMNSIDYVWLSRWDEFAKADAAKYPGNEPRSKATFGSKWLESLAAPPPDRKPWSPVTVVNEGSLSPGDFVKGIGG